MTHIINFSTALEPWPFLRQTEDGAGKWKTSKFVFNTMDNDKCDFIAVYDEPHQPITTIISWENRILFLGEPPSIYTYPKKYLDQFGIVVCPYNIGNIKGRQIKTHTFLPWHFGVTRSSENVEFMNFATLSDFPNTIQKQPGISVVCSNKAITPEHIRRLEFLEKLKTALGDRLHVFGRGFQEIDDKANAIIPYEFHLVLENNAIPHFWTEKTADAFLGCSYPIFSGCKNIHEYFSEDALTAIDITNIDQAINKIKTILDTPGFYQNHLDAIKTARQKIMYDYNTFSAIHTVFENATIKTGHKQVIYPSKYFKVKHRIKKLVLYGYHFLKDFVIIQRTDGTGSPFGVSTYFKKKYMDLLFFSDLNNNLGKTAENMGYFGQRGQDMYLDQTVFKGKTNGVFIDIGANHPKKLSNTYFFEKNRNWSGIAFEPQSRFQEMWQEQRSAPCFPYLLGDNDNDTMPFLEINTDEWQNALSGIDGYIAQNVNALDGKEISKKMVQMHRLDTILRQQGIHKVDFITIDVEGFELNVLKGINLNEFGVEALVIENDRTLLGDDTIRDYICKQGYRHIARLSGDDIFKRIA